MWKQKPPHTCKQPAFTIFSYTPFIYTYSRWLEIVSRRVKTVYKCACASIFAWHKHAGWFWNVHMHKCRSCWVDFFAIFILSFAHKLKSSRWIFPIFGLFDCKDGSNPHVVFWRFLSVENRIRRNHDLPQNVPTEFRKFSSSFRHSGSKHFCEI